MQLYDWPPCDICENTHMNTLQNYDIDFKYLTQKLRS